MSLDRPGPSRWLDDFFSSYYAVHPVSATFIGVHEHDHRLPDYSEAGLGDALAQGRALSEAAAELVDVGSATATTPAPAGRPEGVADPSPRLDRRLALGFLDIQAWELASGHFQRGNPSLYTGEAIFGVMGLFLSDFAPFAEQAEAALRRMEAIPAFLAQVRDNVRRTPGPWTERAIRECDGAAAFFGEGIDALLRAENGRGGVTADQGDAGETGRPHRLDEARTRALRAAADRASAGFADHRLWLETELLGRPRDSVACGEDALELHIRHGHFLHENPFLPRDPDDIVRYAEEQMADAEAYAAEHAGDFGARTPAEVLARVGDAHPTAEGYHAAYRSVWDEVRGLATEHDVVTWPEFPIRYVPRPVWARGAAPYLYFLFYRSPAAFRRPPVHDYLVAPLPGDGVDDFLRANNTSVIKLNHVIHHGGLGHHVQNWHAFRAQSRLGRVAAVDCASRIAMHCGGTMAEGWACYATDLAAEIGALTPLEEYAQVHARARMAARAIVDVRLHQGRMTLDEAAELYASRAGMSEAAARGEAVKNSMFPGGALMYLIGTDTIHTLRGELSRRLGASFDLRAFHDTFLSFGSIPVSLIAKEMMQDGFEPRRLA